TERPARRVMRPASRAGPPRRLTPRKRVHLEPRSAQRLRGFDVLRVRPRDRHERDLVSLANGAEQAMQEDGRRLEAAGRGRHRREQEDPRHPPNFRRRRRDSQSNPAAYEAWASMVRATYSAPRAPGE